MGNLIQDVQQSTAGSVKEVQSMYALKKANEVQAQTALDLVSAATQNNAPALQAPPSSLGTRFDRKA